jgi:hypothetical protein
MDFIHKRGALANDLAKIARRHRAGQLRVALVRGAELHPIENRTVSIVFQDRA